jgi:1-acyl-sn-glycerol-3-phosphate acyltransferase
MFELMRLSGQEYVDEYAAVVKLRLAGKPVEPAAAAEPLASPEPAEGAADSGATHPAGERAGKDDGGAAAAG